MNTNALNSWIASFGLHIILFAGMAIVWKPNLNSNPDPSISVDIVSDFTSSIGSETKIDTLSSNITEDNNEDQSINSQMANNDLEINEAEPIPITPQKPLINENIKPNETNSKIAPSQKTMANPALSPSNFPKEAKEAIKKQIQNPTAQPSKKKINDDFPFQFDLAAATKSSEGVNSGGAKNPKLSKSGVQTKGNSKGGGEKLSSSLNNAISEQVKPCWAEPADLSNPKSLMVMVEMELLPNGNLAKPPKLVYPTSKSGASPSLIVAIDNALRAAKQCAPYVLPSERYDEWKNFSFNFDPNKLKQK